MLRDDGLLVDMLLAARRVRRYVKDRSWASFAADEILQDAVMRQIAIIGEAASQLSDSFTEGHPSLPWRQIIGMRHRLVHGYGRVKLPEVWAVAIDDVSELLNSLERLVPPESGAP